MELHDVSKFYICDILLERESFAGMYSIVISGLNRSRYEFCIMESLPSILLVFPPILPYNILSLISLTIQLNSITQPIVLITYSQSF